MASAAINAGSTEGRPVAPTTGLVETYVDQLDHGLMLVDRHGRIALCTPQARRLLGLPADPFPVGSKAVSALRRVPVGASESRAELLHSLRIPLRDRRPSGLQLAVGTVDLSITLRPLADAGWAVTVAERRITDDRRPDGWQDILTGLLNRACFAVRLREALARYARTGESCALFAVDLDRFKQVNDTLGHPVGDDLLRKVAERLQSAVRSTDAVARFGGDEFTVLQSGVASPEEARVLARRIVDLLGRCYMVNGHLINIGASVGVALVPADAAEADLLLKYADLALYRAKLDGRDTFRFFEPEMSARMDARRHLELDLRKALALRQFKLYYQPQLNLESGRLVGCEALIRWQHPTRGLVPPADFIPLAEETGLIVAIGEWVVATACKEAARWPDHLTVAVNLSPAQFKSKKLVNKVGSALAVSGLNPQRLELEVTEGVLLHENEANLATLHALRGLGLRISMDDFGTGYASLSYLRAFPFDKIKIDRSFVSGEGRGADSMAIVRAIASLGASFGMTTVAEGVETPDQMQRIRTGGCTDVQGYLISRPMPAADLMTFFTNQDGGATPETVPNPGWRP